MSSMKIVTTTLLLISFTMPFSAPALAQDYFISDAKLVTNTTDGIIEQADIIVRDGKITEFGENLIAPDNAQIINASGRWVTPGLIAPFSHLGLVDIDAEDATNDISSWDSETSISELASDSFNPKAASIANTRRHGITHAVVSPDTAGNSIFAGTGLIANLSGNYKSVENNRAFIYLELGESGTRRAGGSRAAAMAQLRAALDDAIAYPDRYKGPEDGDVLNRQDASALLGVISGQMPIIIAADRGSDLLNIIELQKAYTDLDIIVLGAAEGWKVADELAAAKVKVMVDPHNNLPLSFDMVESSFDNILILDAAGVEYAITNTSSLDVTNAANLNQHAGNAVGNGLSWDKAFAAITATPAEWFNLDLGTIISGQEATLVIWDGDPLNVTSAPIDMFISGKRQSLKSRQTALRDRYMPTSKETKPYKYR